MPTSLRELALLFLKLGATSFGGPAAHIAMMQEEVVRRRGWLDEQRFLDLVGAVGLIPGPSSTELAIHIGWERRRAAGLLVAGLCFLLPAVAITAALAAAYVRWGSLPAVGWLLYGVKPVIVAVILQAIWTLAPRAARTTPLLALGAGSLVAAALEQHELLVLFGAGAAHMLWTSARRSRAAPALFVGGLPLALAGAVPAATPASVFLVFVKIGSVLFGSGYVLLAFLRADLVGRLGWLTEAQLLDAVAVGQITPGPLFSTATFIGWVLAGPAGAAAATAGIFLPAFVFVALSIPLLARVRASPLAGAFLDGVNVASLALMVGVTVQIGQAAVVDGPTLALAAIATVLVLRFRVPSTWLVLAGAGLGALVHALGLAI